MNCETVRANLLAYLDGEVSDEERAATAAHLARCPECAAELERLRALRFDLQDAVPAGLEQVRLPAEAEARIRARLRRAAGERRRIGLPLRTPHPRLALVKAAIPLFVILFLVFAGLFVGQPPVARAQETLVVAPSTLAPGTDAALRVVVRQRGSAQPVSGAEVEVRLRPQGQDETLLYSGRTGEAGSAEVRFRVPEYAADRLAAELVVTADSARGRSEVRQPVEVRRPYRLYLGSDRPLYQPGQTLYLRVLALDAARSRPAGERTVLFQVQGVHGERLYQGTARTSAYGIAAAEYTLPAGAPAGTYRLIAALGDVISTRTVTVGAYERPRFRVELSADRSYYLPGQRVSGQVIARTLDGRPLPGAAVSLRAEMDTLPGAPLAELQGRSSETGVWAFSFELPEGAQARLGHLALRAVVRDEGGQAEWAGRVLPVAARPMAIDVVAEGGRLHPGVENTVYVLVATPDGAPVYAHLFVRAGTETYELDSSRFGLAEFRLTPQKGTREVQVEVIATGIEDRSLGGDTLYTTLSADRGPAQVLLRLDRAAYQVGETMQVEVLSGQGEAVYLDVVHRGRGQTIRTDVARLRDGRAALAVDVSPDMAGTIEVHAYQVLPDGTLAGDARLAVVDAPQEVTVELRPDRSVYRPGDVARVRIDTTLAGAPVQSALGIAVVDEAVYALEERAPGFAKLFFLLDASLLDLEARPLGVTLPDLLAPPDVQEVRAAQDVAARAAWAGLPAGELTVGRSAAVTEDTLQTARRRALGTASSVVLILVALALWAVVLRRARGVKRLWREAVLLLGLTFVLLLPAVAAVAGLVALLHAALARALLLVLLLTWLTTWALLGADARRRRDESTQIALLLAGAYGALLTFAGALAEQGGDPGRALILGVLAATLLALAALGVLAAAFWAQGRRGAAAAVLLLVLLSAALGVLAGAAWATTSSLSRTLADPRAYAGPAGWLAGCAPAAREAPAEKSVVETVVVEKEVTREVEKEVAKEVEKELQPTASPVVPAAQPTPTPAGTATAAPTGAPTGAPTPTAGPQAATPAPQAPPPLLGQFVPETIYWAPEAISDAEGQIEIEIPLPALPATWRLTALASTRQGELGSGSAILHAAP